MKLRRQIFGLLLIACFLGLAACSSTSAAQPKDDAPTERAESAEQSSALGAPPSEGRKSQSPEAGDDAPGPSGPQCPMAVEGTTATPIKLDGAAAIDFVTTGDAEALRQQVQKMVLRHQKRHVEPGQMPEPPAEKLEKMNAAQREKFEKRREKRRLMRTATVVGEQIEGGMRVKLAPANPAELDKLYEVVERTSERLTKRGSECKKHSGKHQKRRRMRHKQRQNPGQRPTQNQQ